MTAEAQPILLAAGQSTRFGNDKLLTKVQLNDIYQPLILHSIQRWLSTVTSLILVVRPDNSALKSLLQAHPDIFKRLRLVEAFDADNGMGYSLASGVRANQQADGWLVGLADMPLIPVDVLQTSMQLLVEKAELTVPFYQQQRGHPVGFSARYREDLLALQGDVGAKSILMSNKAKITSITSADRGVCLDIDTLEDLIQLSAFT